MKFMKEFLNTFSQKPAFQLSEAMTFLRHRGASKGYHKLIVQNLVKSGKLHRITKGSYTFYDEAQFVGYAFEPFYYGLEDALSFRDLWSQETNPVVITPRKVRVGVRQFESRNYVVRTIKRSMFFGFDYVKYDEYFLPVSTIEKTLIDLVYFGISVPGDTVSEIAERMDNEALETYLKEIPDYLRVRVNRLLSQYMN